MALILQNTDTKGLCKRLEDNEMRVIYKYPLKIVPEQVVEIPRLCENGRIVEVSKQILHIESQSDVEPCMWCMVDTDMESVPVKIVTRCTGEPTQDYLSDYIGTYLWNNGQFVGHVFASPVGETEVIGL